MKNLYLLGLSLFTTLAFAQVKVGGTPTVNPDAMLEIEGKGLLLPRLELVRTSDATPLSAHVEGMTVYNLIDQNDVKQGFYYNDGIKWNQMVTTDNKAVKFFYMPSISFDTSVSATGKTKNLYEEYKNQFSLAPGGNHKSSVGAPTDGIPYFTSATDLYYYVTDYDPAVFSNISIEANGLMTYDVTAAATDCSLINIVFVVK